MLLVERALEILNEGDALTEMPALIRAAQDADQHALEEVIADLAADYGGPNYFSEGKYFAVDCEEEVPFTDAARTRADIASHPAFAISASTPTTGTYAPIGSDPMPCRFRRRPS